MRHQKGMRALPLAAAGLLWTALAAAPATAQQPVVERQSTSTATSGSKPSRSASSSKPSRNSNHRATSQSASRNRSRAQAGTSQRQRGPSHRGDFRDHRREQRVHGQNRHSYDRERSRRQVRNRHRDYRHRGSYGHYGHYGHRSNYYRGHYGYHYPRYRYPTYAYYGAFGFHYPGWVSAYWERPYVHRRPVAVYVDNYDNGGVGALDLDVSPEKAEIFIDGNRVGVADNFDGFPTFLWLEEGTYDVAIYRPGYETIFRQYTIYPGVVIDVEDRMQPGEAVHPDDHGPKSTVNRDDRRRRNQERARAAGKVSPPEVSAPEPAPESERETAERRPTGESEIGRLVLDVYPPDAAVYLDGYFLGTASEVTGIRAGLVVDPGEHLLEVTRPGYLSREIEVDVSSGERMDLVIELEEEKR